MSSKKVKVEFITPHDPSVIAVDIYGDAVPQKPTSRGSDENTNKGGNIADNTGKFLGGFAKNVAGVIDRGLKGGTIQDIHKSLSDIVGGDSKLLDNLKREGLTDVLTGLGVSNPRQLGDAIVGDPDPLNLLNQLGQSNPQLGIVVNGITTIVNAGDINNVSDGVKLLGNLTGNKELVSMFDLESQALAFSSMLNTVSRLRIPEIIDTVLRSAEEKKIKEKLLIQSILKLARNSDLYTLRKAIELLGDADISVLYPNLLSILLSHYKRVDKSKVITKDESDYFKETLSIIKDKWWFTKRGKEDVWNMDLLRDVSDDAKSLLFFGNKDDNDETLRSMIQIAGQYRPAKTKSIMKQLRPWGVMTVNG